MNNRSSLDGGILPQNHENFPLNPENYANILSVETTTQFTSFLEDHHRSRQLFPGSTQKDLLSADNLKQWFPTFVMARTPKVF